MIDKNKIFNNLKYIESMNQHGASPNLDEYWDEIVKMLSEDLEKTKQFLNDCTEHQIWFMAGYFEDISYKLQSEEFITFLKELQKKHPNIDIKQDIEWAEDALE
ncbi:MAG: hypothetical protein E7J99_12980 [Clostridium butyricum]|uniref:hypothetical protein n=1 Tax=Clostridium TaxID=1485 RepID=UPI002903DF1F|nr:hypothetical protein [Clostridium sp.]MDU1114621.1 hypothetical protein [Clostridium sp.]MDU7713063.1 hypothetical protein [Clostridium butyricum]